MNYLSITTNLLLMMKQISNEVIFNTRKQRKTQIKTL